MNRFNVTFRGEIVDGHDPEQVRTRLAEALAIDDPKLLQQYFSGKPVVLRRDMARRDAAELYARLRRLGAHAELVKVGARRDPHGGDKSGAAALAIATAKPVARSTGGPDETGSSGAASAVHPPAKDTPEEPRRRADLAAGKALRSEEAAQLKSKERALKKALRARAKEAAKRDKVSEQEQRDKARREEQLRLAAQRVAREREKRKAEQIAAVLQLENARKKREQAEEAARRKAQEAQRRARELARKEAEEEEQRAQRQAMEEQSIRRAAQELAQKPSLKPVEARVKTRLETPSRKREPGDAATGARRKRQPGAPNLYGLRPFRNTAGIRARAGESRRIMRLAFSCAAIAVAAAVVFGAGLLNLPPPSTPRGASAIVLDPQQRPLLLAGDHLLLHDRAGVSITDITLDSLGLSALAPPMEFNAAGELLAPGLPAGVRATPAQAAAPPLMRCVLAEPGCEPYSEELNGTVISSLAVHPLDGNLFIADSRAGELLKVSPAGKVLARTAARLPAHPVLRLDSGLLLVNSVTGPTINVLRYENDAFGQQLDEIPLTPPGAGANEFVGVIDFLWNGEYWWALLDRANGEGATLHRYDARWQLIDKPGLTPGGRPVQLADWGGRILVADPTRIAVQRFNSSGAAETPLVSAALSEQAAGQARRANLILLGWRIGLTLCLLAAAASLCLGWLHRARSLVYTSCREKGAEPVDKLADGIDWIEVAPNRSDAVAQRGIACGALATVLIACAVGFGVSTLQLSALLLALVGPATALLLLQRSEPGYIGIAGEELLLVDHDGMYHLGSGSRIHYRGPFLMIDDVTVFTGSRLLPAFTRALIDERVAPIAAGGVKVDRTIVTVKLLQSRHPLALGAVAIAASSAAAIALLSLHGIF